MSNMSNIWGLKYVKGWDGQQFQVSRDRLPELKSQTAHFKDAPSKGG